MAVYEHINSLIDKLDEVDDLIRKIDNEAERGWWPHPNEGTISSARASARDLRDSIESLIP